MTKLTATPRLIGTAVLALSILALAAVALPSAALAAPEEGPGTVSAAPDPIVLPATTVGGQSPSQSVTLSYEGEGVASVNKVTIVGAEAGEFLFNNSSCGDLLSGQSCQVSVSTKPNNVSGEKHAQLSVTFNGSRPEAQFEISYEAVLPQLRLTPESHDFGLVPVHREQVSTNFLVENDGEAQVQIGGLGISGPGSEAFSTGAGNCSGGFLLPGQSCSIEVDFHPNQQQLYEAELLVFANGSTFSAGLSGEGGRAIIGPTEGPPDFGPVTVGTQGAVRTITLENSGDVGEGFFIGIVAGGDAGSFHLLDENCSGVEFLPATTCAVHIRFNPLSAGKKTARLAFFGEGEGGVMMPLSGEGVAPAVTLAPLGFDFGSEAVGSKSAGHSFEIGNEGTTPLEYSRVAISGADLDQFALAGDDCTGTALAPGDRCQVRVRFAPDSAGAKKATLRLSGDAGTLTAALAGTGSAAATAAGSEPSAVTSVVVPSRAARAARIAAARRHRLFIRGHDVVRRRGERPHRVGPRR